MTFRKPKNLDKMDDCAKLGWAVVNALEDVRDRLGADAKANLRIGRRAYDCALGWPQFVENLNTYGSAHKHWFSIPISIEGSPEEFEIIEQPTSAPAK